MTFAEKIVKLRKLKGLTQDEFASAVGVSRQAVYKWESGQSYPEVSKLLEIKLLFNISIDDLLDENYVVVLPEKKRKKRIPKEVKREIEERVEKEIPREEDSIYEAVSAESTPIESVKEESAVTESEPTPAPVVYEAPAETAEQDEINSQISEQKEESAEKKKGFFGRLFGRK